MLSVPRRSTQEDESAVSDFSTDQFSAAFGFGLIVLCCCILAIRNIDIMKMIREAKHKAEQRAREMSQRVYAVGAGATAKGGNRVGP